MNYVIVSVIIALIGVFIFYYRNTTDTFYNIQEETQNLKDDYYKQSVINQLAPAQKNQNVTVNELSNLLKELINVNGPPQGANVSVTQNKYDLIFKDILISSNKRNTVKYPNPNNYNIELNLSMDKIYKAELIDVYIPAATDNAVNIPVSANRLYFSYRTECQTVNSVDGYIIVQAGTYKSPDAIAQELTRQFITVLTGAGMELSKTVGVTVIYDKNLNRYIFKDRNHLARGTLTIYPTNGYVLNQYNKVTDSITYYLMLNYEGPAIYSPYVSGPIYIDSKDGVLFPRYAVPGDYGKYNGYPIPVNSDCLFSNCIISDVVLTDCKLFLSLGKLNGNTCNIVPDQGGNNTGNVPPVFCQIPNNTCVSSSSVKTLLNQPNSFSAIQFYNPPISKVNKLHIKWYTEDGSLVRILDHCFTLRLYYFQKRIDTTDFSYPIP